MSEFAQTAAGEQVSHASSEVFGQEAYAVRKLAEKAVDKPAAALYAV